MLSLFTLSPGRAVRYETPSDVKRRYRYLYDEPVQHSDDGSLSFHEARLWRRDGINVLAVRGDRFEMAYQHGRLLRQEIADGSLEQASQIARNGIKNSVGEGLLFRAIDWYSGSRIAETMLRHSLGRVEGPRDLHLAEAYGLSEATGVPVRTIVRAALGPETAQVLVGQTEDGIGFGGPSQCTSFAAWGSATQNGELVIGRNTDYPLNGFYDRHPTVIYFEPTDGSLRYMATTSAGFHNAGVCGMNEAGIYLDVHTVLTRNTSGSGMPIFMVGQEVLRTATSFERAAEILRENKPAAGWSYQVVSTRERRVATFEMANDHVSMRAAEGDYHVTTNHWSTAEMEPRALNVNPTVEEDSRARMQRVEELVREAGGQLDARGAAAILGDKLDPITRRHRAFPNTIAATFTVSSSVWRPDQGKMYIANGVAPVSQNTFVELPTIDAFDRGAFGREPYETFKTSRFEADHAGAARAQRSLIEARKCFEYANDAVAALAPLEAAAAADASDPALHLMLALMATRAGKLEVAERAANAALACDFDAKRKVVAHYLLGRILADRGEVSRAEAALADVATSADASEKLVKAAKKTRRSLARRRRVALAPTDIAPMTFYPDAFRYESIVPW